VLDNSSLCRQCGFHWSITPDAAMDLIARVPVRLAEMLADTDGSQRHPDLHWTAGAYVCHVTDRSGLSLAGARRARRQPAGARVRREPARPSPRLRAGSLGRSLVVLECAARDWQEAVHLALARDAVLLHAGMGEQRVADVARNNAHNAHHHACDIRRSMM